MGTYSIIIPTTRGEMELRAQVPDKQGFESSTVYHERIIRFLNQKYGLDGWHEPVRTTAFLAHERALQSNSPSIEKLFDTIQRQAKNREKILKKLLG